MNNIWELKKILNRVLRYLLLGTLAAKHKWSIKRMIDKYSMVLKVEYIYIKNGKKLLSILASYPTKEYYNKKKKGFNFSFFIPGGLDNLLKIEINTANVFSVMNYICAVTFCEKEAQVIYHITKLRRRLQESFITAFDSRKLQGWEARELVLKRKQVFLCKSCSNGVYMGKVTMDDFNSEFIFTIKGLF